ncbi:Uncharacterized protein Adt_04740 [Abeliophyllum distichum]|uniref:Uncharacterized protein n=1 Tax=Abeliophyllum distichum TaxID=126358 RepID=A0ABD1V246_9LAMI
MEAKEVAVVEDEAAENDTKRQSLGYLFQEQNDGKLGSDEKDKTTNELVEQKSSETGKASDIPEAKPQEDVRVKSPEPVADTLVKEELNNAPEVAPAIGVPKPEASDEKKEIVKPATESLETEPSQTIEEEKPVEIAKVETLEEKKTEEKPVPETNKSSTPDQTNSLETETSQKKTEEKVETLEEKKMEEKPIPETSKHSTPDQTKSLETETSQKKTEEKPVDTPKVDTVEEKKIEDKPNTAEQKTEK